MKRISLMLSCAAVMFLGVTTLMAQETGGSIQGAMYVDADGDGQYDEGEEVAAKITLLTLKDGKWVPLEASYSMENGQFAFENVPFGTYRVQFEFPGGFTRTTQSFEVNSGNTRVSMVIPLTHTPQGNLLIPDSYSQGTDSLSFVNLGALVGEEVSTFQP